MKLPDHLLQHLRTEPKLWVVTGGAGFIGSNIVQGLLEAGQQVRCFDNFSAGFRSNLDHVQSKLTADQWSRFELIVGDIRDASLCAKAAQGASYVIHQAALASVPMSVDQPELTHEVNVNGTMNVMLAAREAKVKRLVYATSSAVFGNCAEMPLRESAAGQSPLLSPYAAHKRINEMYGEMMETCYGLETVGLRYFNVFGPRQDPNGAYAAVIPKWITSMVEGKQVTIHGDGETSRDFCYVGDVVQANLLAATTDLSGFKERVFNVGLGKKTSLNELYALLVKSLVADFPELKGVKPVHGQFRAGDVRHSQADVSMATKRLGFTPMYEMEDGLKEAMDWYRTCPEPVKGGANPESVN